MLHLEGKLEVFFHVLNSCLLLELIDATPNEVDLLLVVAGPVVTLQEQEAKFLFLSRLGILVRVFGRTFLVHKINALAVGDAGRLPVIWGVIVMRNIGALMVADLLLLPDIH